MDASALVPGVLMSIGNTSTTGQLLRVVSVSGSIATVRPRVRRAYPDNTLCSIGRPTGYFRIMDTPTIVFAHDRSMPFELQFEELWTPEPTVVAPLPAPSILLLDEDPVNDQDPAVQVEPPFATV